MTAKREAEQRLEDIVSLSQSVITLARAAQAAMAQIAEAPPERKEDEQ
jgi:hypothetical protein